MKIIDKTGVASIEDQRLEVAVRELGIVYTGVGADAATLKAELDAISFVANLQTNAGTKPVVFKMPLSALMEIDSAGTSGEGAVYMDVANKTIEGKIALSNNGALDLGADTLTVSFLGLNQAASLQVYGIDDKVLSPIHIVYEPNHFDANTPKELNVSEYYQLAIPRSIVDFVEFKYVNGRVVKYTAKELALRARKTNELSYMVSQATFGNDPVMGVITGGKDWIVEDIAQVVTARVSLNDEGKVYLVKNAALEL